MSLGRSASESGIIMLDQLRQVTVEPGAIEIFGVGACLSMMSEFLKYNQALSLEKEIEFCMLFKKP